MVVEVPAYSFHDALFKGRFRLPAEFVANLRGVDAVTLVVPEAVGYEGDEVFVDPVYADVALRVAFLLAEERAVFRVFLHELVHGADNDFHDLDILPLVVAAHVVDAAIRALRDDEVDGLAVVFHVEPVAHVGARAVNGELLALQYVVDDQRNELLGELIRAVVVGAARYGNGHVIRVAVGAHDVVGTRLGGTVRTVRVERRCFHEIALSAEAAVHFVGRNLMEAHAAAPGGVALFVASRLPSRAGGVKEALRAEDIGLQEELRIFDAAVHVALGGKVHHHVEAVFGKEAVDEFAVANVAFHEEAAFVVYVFRNRAEVAGVGEQVEHHHAHVIVFFQDVLQIVCADKAGGTSNEISFHKIV